VKQYNLYGGLPPHQRHSSTSRAAAIQMLPTAGTKRRLVYDLLLEWAKYGGTDEQIQVALQMPGNVQRPRRIELVAVGLVRDSGRTRKTKSGRQATIWVAASWA